MVVYGLGILPLIQKLQKYHPGITQTWYADDAGAGGTFGGIRQHLDNLMVRRPPCSYLQELTNRILVVSPWNVPPVEAFFRGYMLNIVTGSLYLRSFVGTKAAQDLWLV